jgi:hypothetical protein
MLLSKNIDPKYCNRKMGNSDGPGEWLSNCVPHGGNDPWGEVNKCVPDDVEGLHIPGEEVSNCVPEDTEDVDSPGEEMINCVPEEGEYGDGTSAS